MQEVRDEISQVFHDNQIPLKIDISKYLEKEKEQSIEFAMFMYEAVSQKNGVPNNLIQSSKRVFESQFDKRFNQNKQPMNETTKSFNQELINQQEFLPDTSIFSTVDGEITDIINIKDSFRFLPQEEKLKIVSVLLEWCAAETSKLT